jgi:sortase A
VVAVLNRLLGALGRTLITVGTIVLLFAGYQLWGTGVDEANHQEQLTRDLATSLGVDAAPSMSATAVDAAIQRKLEAIDPATAPPMLPPREADVVGTISIPRIGLLDKKFVEGVSKADLRAGPGHYQGTSFPGQAGNSAIAGHRTTYGAPFNRIDELSPGDQIIVSTRQGRFVYEVVASPEDTRTGEAGDRWGDAWYTVTPDNVGTDPADARQPPDPDRLPSQVLGEAPHRRDGQARGRAGGDDPDHRCAGAGSEGHAQHGRE